MSNLQSRKDRVIISSPYNASKRKRPIAVNPRVPSGPNVKTARPKSNTREENSKVKVYVRIRPFNQRESQSGCKNVLAIVDEKTLIFDPKETRETFFFQGVAQKGRDLTKKVNKNLFMEFDRVFDSNATNDEVFEVTTKDIIKSIFDGYNCSVFAYGATGAGKTYTMLGTEEKPGITYLTIVELLKHIENSDNLNVTLGASYIEVYNENVRDLLHPEKDFLQLREDASGGVAIQGLDIEKITSSDQLFGLLNTGNQNRSQHPTDSNSESSRSHAIFQVHVRMQNSGVLKIAKLSMIDLAGSERGTSTGCSGLRFKEGSNINKSLLALGNCINALADGLAHIKYRDSKLTRILKDSLGGNCQTLMIANISPSSASFEDTYNTLKYASRAKCIKSKISKNVMDQVFSVAHYKKMVTELQDKISKMDSNVLPELDEWVPKIESVMEERLKLTKEFIAIESQKKCTEWRLEHKSNLKLLFDPVIKSKDLSKIMSSISQLKGRIDSGNGRQDDIPPALSANTKKLKTLKSEIDKNEKLARILKPLFDFYEQKMTSEMLNLQLEHVNKALKLHTKREEVYKNAVNSAFQTMQDFYSLLQSFGHGSELLTSKYLTAVKDLEGMKAVTWSDGDEDQTSKSALQLSLSRLQNLPDSPQLQAENTDANRTPYRGKILGVLPKSKTFLKPSTFNRNKENIKLVTPLSKVPADCYNLSSKGKILSRNFPLRSTQNSILNARSYVKFKATSARKTPVSASKRFL